MSRITKEQVDLCVKHGDCRPWIGWAYANIGANWEEVEPGWTLWAVRVLGPDIITPERLDRCAEMEPRVALKYAAKHLAPERLDRCAEIEPGYALEYAAEYLSPEQCAELWPWYASKYAAKRLTPERLDWCRNKI